MPILMYMRGAIGKYETIVRLGPVFIVVILLLLNVNSTYVLHHVRDQLTAELDERLSSSLKHAQRYLAKNQRSEIGDDQILQIRQKYGVDAVGSCPVSSRDLDGITACLGHISPGPKAPRDLTTDAVKRLLAGNDLYYSEEDRAVRLGLALLKISSGEDVLIYSWINSDATVSINRAARKTLYLVGAVLALIIPIVIGFPRQILKPFKKMRETAESAGKLITSPGADEVTEIIKSYESIIGELKRKEIELERLCRESSSRADRLEQLNRYILKSIGSGVINVDLTGKVIGYNRAARSILSYEEELVLGRHYLTAFPREMELCLFIEAGLERGEVSGHREIVLKRPEEPDQWLGMESSLIFDDGGRVVGVTLLITDLTGLKKLQLELETNRRLAALGEMTGGLAHQLRNSLAAISGFCQLLQKKTGADSTLGDIAASIRTEAAASATMVSRFLTFARPLSLTEEVFDLRVSIDECMAKYRAEAASNGIMLDFRGGHEVAKLVGDPLLLKEAISNVVANALEAAGQGGKVEIGVERQASGLVLTVTDNGPGIPEGLKEKLFTPFVSSKPSGTGLGLALARKIINLHNGSITLESAHPRGSICRIVLRCLVDKAESPGARPETAKKQ